MAMKQFWQSGKQGWEKVGKPALEPPILAQMGKQGWDKGDLAGKLGAVDQATTLDAKKTAWTPAFTLMTSYAGILDKASSASKSAKAKTELDKLAKSLDVLLEDGRKSTADPKPTGRAAKVDLVSGFNLAAGLKTKWLKAGAVMINAYFVFDDAVTELEKAGELGYQWSEVQKACSARVEKDRDAFLATIKELDAKISILSKEDRDKKVKEANDVLKHYAKIVETNLNKVADDYWARALKRRAYLKAFKTECKKDIALSTIAIATSVVSIAMTFGAAAPSAIVIAKAVLDIALTLDKLDRDADRVKSDLAEKMKTIEALYGERKKAKKTGASQAASKAAQVGKTAVASALGPAGAKLMTTAVDTLKEAQEFTGRLSETEKEAGKLSKKIDEFTRKFPSSPEGPDAASSEQMRKVYQSFLTMEQCYADFTNELQRDINWGEKCIAVCEALKKEDAVVTFTKQWATTTKAVGAIASAAKFTYQLATALA
jgi:hypothetical protein